MAAMLRILFALLLLFTGLLVLGGLQATWAARLGWEGLDIAALRILVDGPRRQAEIRNYNEIVRQRLQGKDKITRDLLDGRLSLFEAAARFRKLEELTSEYIGYSREPRPGETVEENLCHQVIRWVHHEAAVRTYPEPDQLAQRLEEELREHIQQHGRVRLPEE
jgi:hypothetical protein